MATSFLNKAGLTSLWAKIKATFALKSEIPDSTSDLTNDSGFIDSARFDITVTSSWDSATDTYTYTADKTYQQIATAITEGKIPYVTYSGSLYKYLGIHDGMIAFSWDGLSNLVDGQGAIISTSLAYTVFYVDSTNTWERYADSAVIASKTSQLTNDSGFITSADVMQSISPATTSTLGGVIVGTGLSVTSTGLTSLNFATEADIEEMLAANGFNGDIIDNWEELT